MKMLLILVLSLQLASLNAFSVARCSRNDKRDYILDTNNGKIKGSCSHVVINGITDVLSDNVYSFLSIPYAEPPVGENRFEAPKPAKPWSNVLDGTKWPNTCIQYTDQSIYNLKPEEQFPAYKMWLPSPKHTNYSEDCLYLNLWLPADAYYKMNLRSNSSQKVPILIFVHGSSGTTALDIYDPSNLVAATGVIAVTITYRASLFGSLYLNDNLAGNQAFLDQNLAFQWVHANAERIGGDPNRITLMGSSAGAMAIGFHLMYRPSWPLFRNVILQAGSPFHSPITPVNKAEANERARQYLISIGCGNSSNTNAELVACAKQRDAQYLAKTAQEFFVNRLLDGNANAASYLMSAFPPVIDGTIIKETPEEAFKRNNFKSCSILTGFAADEGSMFVAYAGLMGTKMTELRKQVSVNFTRLVDFLNDYLKYYPVYPKKSSKALIDLILFQYTKLTSSSNHDSPLMRSNYFNALSRIIGDQVFVCPSLKLADTYARRNHSVYVYLYSHRLSTSPWPSWYGTVHADELAMVFGQPVSTKSYASAISTNPWLATRDGYFSLERRLSNDMMFAWANFIKNDNPNDMTNEQKILLKWPKYTVQKVLPGSKAVDGQYLILKTNGTKISRNYALEECQFWNQLLPTIIEENGNFLFQIMFELILILI